MTQSLYHGSTNEDPHRSFIAVSPNEAGGDTVVEWSTFSTVKADWMSPGSAPLHMT